MILNAVFAAYTLVGNDLSAGIAFPVISLFGSLSGPIQGIPSMISGLIETHISVKRIQKFLLTEEIDTKYILNYNSRTNPMDLTSELPKDN